MVMRFLGTSHFSSKCSCKRASQNFAERLKCLCSIALRLTIPFFSLFFFFFPFFLKKKKVPKPVEILESFLLITGCFNVVLIAWFTDKENYIFHWQSYKLF